MNTHKTDAVGELRAREVVCAVEAGPHMDDVEVLSHVEHPVDESISITTVAVSGVNTMDILVLMTTRDPSGGTVEVVARSNVNCAA